LLKFFITDFQSKMFYWCI